MTGSSIASNLRMRAFLLAGGRSTRMGQDKALLRIHGQPLAAQMLAKLRALGLEATLCGNREDLASFAPVIPDLGVSCGPLGGIDAALQATDTDLNLVLAVDLPALPVAFLRWMIARAARTGAAATIPYAQGRPQPLCAVYHRELAPELRQCIEEGEFRIMAAVHRGSSRIDRFMVEQIAAAEAFDIVPDMPPVHTWFRNLNTPEEVARYAASHSSNKLASNKLERDETAD